VSVIQPTPRFAVALEFLLLLIFIIFVMPYFASTLFFAATFLLAAVSVRSIRSGASVNLVCILHGGNPFS
jgi:hypothetical protein